MDLPQLLIGMLVGLVAGAAAAWSLYSMRDRQRQRNQEAYEAEVVRAAGCARDRAHEELEQTEERTARLQEEHSRCEAKIDGLVKQLRNREATVETLETDLADARTANDERTEHVRSLEARIDELETSIEERDQRDGTPGWLSAGPDGATDDLTAIRGLGPVLEERLNALGIYRYRQLAQMTPENTRWIAMKLQIVPGRVRRDRWAEQARELHERKTDGPA